MLADHDPRAAHSLAACPVACLDGLGRLEEEHLALAGHSCQEEDFRSHHILAAHRTDCLQLVSCAFNS